MGIESRGERDRAFVLQEYEALCQLEQETTKMRHNTFTALISISFVLTGLAFRDESSSVVQIPLVETMTSSQLAATFGFMFLVVSSFAMYGLLLLWSIRWDDEPLEDHSGLN